ncbi:MAG: hypothetical protein DI538_25780 [Azospira oryzae]|nr:MAG: hypothetical protein DI538_25780 [Azospira oryzae]
MNIWQKKNKSGTKIHFFYDMGIWKCFEAGANQYHKHACHRRFDASDRNTSTGFRISWGCKGPDFMEKRQPISGIEKLFA